MEYRRFKARLEYKTPGELPVLKSALEKLNQHVAGIYCNSRVYGRGLEAVMNLRSEMGKKPIHILVRPCRKNISLIVMQDYRGHGDYSMPLKRGRRHQARFGDYVFDIRYRHK